MNTNKFIKELIIMVIGGLIINVICFFIGTIHGHCAETQDYFPMQQNDNGLFTNILVDSLNRDLDGDNYYYFVKYGYVDGQFTNFYYVEVSKNSDTKLYAEKFNDVIHFSIYKVGNANVKCYRINYLSDGTRGGVYESSMADMQNLVSSKYSSSVSYISNFQLYTDNTDGKLPILLYDDGVSVPEDDTARDDMSKPDISDYIPTWTNKPAWDYSSTVAAIGSIYDMISWLGNNLKNTISGTGEYISDTLRWSIQKVLNTIRDVSTAIQDNILGSLTLIIDSTDNIKNKLNYLTQELDSEVIYDSFSTSDLGSDFTSIKTNINSFVTSFNSVSEPSSYTIPIHIENVSMFSNVSTQYIDLGWLNSVKTPLRAFVWCVVTYGLIMSIIDSIPNYINGGGGEDD